MGSAVLEAESVVSGFEDVAMLSDPVEQRGRHLGVAEHVAYSLKLKFVVITTLARS